MDRISGLMPQTGWSPLLSPATPKNAPATTVEPAATSADTDGGQSAGTDTQTAQDHAQTARLFRGIAAARIDGRSTQSEPVGPPPDPNAPSGPMPTFDVSPLEEATARVIANQVMVGNTDLAVLEAAGSVKAQGESLGQDSAIKAEMPSRPEDRATSAASTQDAAPVSSAAQQWQARPWPQTPQANAPQLDVTR